MGRCERYAIVCAYGYRQTILPENPLKYRECACFLDGLKAFTCEQIAGFVISVCICATNCTTLALNFDPDCELKINTIQLVRKN